MPEYGWIFFLVPFFIVIIGLLVWSLVWVYGDAEKRGKPGALAVLMVFFLNWPASLLAWLLFRPDLPSSNQ